MALFHLSWSEIGQHVVNGITLGSIYALIALGYTMVYGILKFINFAHGEILMMGAYAGYFFYMALNGEGVSSLSLFLFLLAMIGSMLVSATLGVIVEKLAYKPLRTAPRLAPLLSAIGVSIILSNLAAFLFGTKSKRLDYPFPNETILLGNVAITPHQILIVVSALVLMVALKLFVDYSKLGKAMRATSQNMNVAKLMGINTDFIISLTFAIGSALAAAAGMLVALEIKIYPTMGTLAGLKAFVAAVFGGIGNITGAMIGGVLLGVIETFGVAVLGIPQGLRDTVAFTILIFVLLFRPSGLLGKKEKEKV
ncbi:branched-chain amino acid ABC transporter permease [Thermospira aquatica]|uniref:Branched-chain amino acid ABC transporter permease n=1 Tax=Thermospira aquatica TaxID=2828656 RepID=A0AAX3BCK8_9SPIR|nr:branched-chain amino acid ABC transporter permease [Thermospira aquatica]URA09751.1 branched-chain amino acid ABC transporter permease [Thermospira aquatica]